MKLFSGTSNLELSNNIAKHLNCDIVKMDIGTFKDGEIKFNIKENINNEDCFIIQTTSRSLFVDENNKKKVKSVNDNLMELFVMIDAIKRANAKSINLIIPYFGYQRQDRKDNTMTPISSCVVARILETLNVNKVIIYELHASQITGFFSNNCPVFNLHVTDYFQNYIIDNIKDNYVFVAPDAGAIKMNYNLAKNLNTEVFSIFKNRSKNGLIDDMILVGDIKDKNVIMVDDMIDTGGTICRAAKLLRENECKKIYIFVTHGLFSGDAIKNIESSEIDYVVTTNTIPNEKELFINSKIKMIDISKSCANFINNMISN